MTREKPSEQSGKQPAQSPPQPPILPNHSGLGQSLSIRNPGDNILRRNGAVTLPRGETKLTERVEFVGVGKASGGRREQLESFEIGDLQTSL